MCFKLQPQDSCLQRCGIHQSDALSWICLSLHFGTCQLLMFSYSGVVPSVKTTFLLCCQWLSSLSGLLTRLWSQGMHPVQVARLGTLWREALAWLKDNPHWSTANNWKEWELSNHISSTTRALGSYYSFDFCNSPAWMELLMPPHGGLQKTCQTVYNEVYESATSSVKTIISSLSQFPGETVQSHRY